MDDHEGKDWVIRVGPSQGGGFKHMSLLEQHFDRVRNSLLAMYDESKAASHTVVTGTLREGFVRAALQGHLPTGASWSTGQMVGYAPNNDRSGQLDILLHSGELPQIYIHDGYVRLVPSDACIGIVEVKSDITTGDVTKPDSTASLAAALSSLVRAKKVDRRVGENRQSPVPFHIVGFRSGVKSEKVGEYVFDYLQDRSLAHSAYWPESFIVLRGATRTDPDGYGLFRDPGTAGFPLTGVDFPLRRRISGLTVKKVEGKHALAVLVASLANATAAFDISKFKLERYVY